MNHEDLFSAIGTADEKLLQRSEKPLKKQLRPWIAIAACLCLLISAAVLLRPSPAVHRISSEKIHWDMSQDVQFVSTNSINTNITKWALADYQLSTGICVEAKVLAVLPDRYLYPGTFTSSPGYHILRLKVCDTIIGKDLPSELFWAIPVEYATDLKDYSSLIIRFDQDGCENAVVLNATRQRAESFSFLFRCQNGFYPLAHGNVLAYSGGRLDTSLWDKAGWSEGKSTVMSLLEQGREYPGKLDGKIKDAKQVIRQQFAALCKEAGISNSAPPIGRNALYTDEASQKILDYVAPFKNGVFASEFSTYSQCATYYRLVEGFPTNEVYSIYPEDYEGERIHQSSPRFTKKDLENLPDVVGMIDSLDPTAVRETKNGTLAFAGATGHYYKVGSEIIGLVTCSWAKPDPDYEPPIGPSCVIHGKLIEYSYTIILQDGTCKEVSKKAADVYTTCGTAAGEKAAQTPAE